MSSESKDNRAVAMIAVLQSILESLPESPAETQAANQTADTLPPVNDPTHQLFLERLNQASLAGLFASIRIIHHIHRAALEAP